MTHKENQIIQNILEGELNQEVRDELRSQFHKSLSKDMHNMNKKTQKQSFDADSAWSELHAEIKLKGLLNNEKISIMRKNNRWAIAASFILLTGLALSFYFILSHPKNIISVSAENQIKELVLPDGSRITLNTGAKLSYPEKFKSNQRNITFKGEAFFNITKNPNKPFVIKTDNSEIKVLGTSFNVNTEKQKTEVIVKTGRVELKSDRKKIVLNPGDKGISSNGILQKAINNNSNYLSWKTLLFTYENEKLEHIISDINKAYKVNITFRNAEIGEFVAGSMSFNRADDSVETLINIICKTYHLKAETEGKNIILSY